MPDTTPHLLSRRRLLLGAAGIVAIGGGAGGLYLARDVVRHGTSEPASTGAVAPGAGTPGATNPTAATPPATPATDEASTSVVTARSTSDRVLVVVQLTGGNDALNTLVPAAGTYHDLRPTIALADDELLALPFAPDHGLHPALGPLVALLDAGSLAVVAGVGFPAPSRSHFSALDMWWSGTTDPSSTGWLGRWLDSTTPPDPAVLRATGLGGAVPALAAQTARSVGVTEIDRFSLNATGASDGLLAAWAAMDTRHAEAGAAADLLSSLAAAEGVPPDEAGAGGEGTAASLLRVAARLVDAEPGTRVIHVVVPGFDTHAAQLGTHAALLADVAAGIAGFQHAITSTGHADRVLLVTTSEFGRRVQENGSGGTDHGKAGVSFVVGAGLTAPGLHGALDLGALDEGDLRPVVDPRSVYASALDWLDGEHGSSRTDEVLQGSFERLPFGIA